MADAALQRRRRIVDPGSGAAEPFRALRLALRLGSANSRAVVFTSALAQDGKSTVAANYALVSGIGHGKVLLIDADLRRPTLHQFFGVPRSPGLVEVLAEGAPVTEYVHRLPNFGAVYLLAAGRPIPHLSDLSSTPLMAEVIRQAMEEFTHVVIDAPPVLLSAGAEALSAHEGVGIVMVVPRKARKKPVLDALRRLDLVDARVAGLVVNRAGRARKYGY